MLSRAPVSFAVKDDEVATGPEVSDIEHVGVRRRLRQMLAYAGFPMLGVLTPRSSRSRPSPGSSVRMAGRPSPSVSPWVPPHRWRLSSGGA
jgi:hypothetical protein